jgi:hypothetical protein
MTSPARRPKIRTEPSDRPRSAELAKAAEPHLDQLVEDGVHQGRRVGFHQRQTAIAVEPPQVLVERLDEGRTTDALDDGFGVAVHGDAIVRVDGVARLRKQRQGIGDAANLLRDADNVDAVRRRQHGKHRRPRSFGGLLGPRRRVGEQRRGIIADPAAQPLDHPMMECAAPHQRYQHPRLARGGIPHLDDGKIGFLRHEPFDDPFGPGEMLVAGAHALCLET